MDDCSNKQTLRCLKKFSKNKKIKIYLLKKNYGSGYCRNYALKKSNSPYIAFIDSDDLWKKDKLETQLRFMENNNYLFTYTSYETFGKKIKYVKPPSEYDYKKFIQEQKRVINLLDKSNISLREAQLKIEHFWAGSLKKAVVDGDIENGSLMAGQSVSLVKKIQSVNEIIGEIVKQAEKQISYEQRISR